MPSHVKVGGTWRTLTEVHVKVAGTWRKLTRMAVKVAGTWRDVLEVPLDGSINPSTWNDSFGAGTGPHQQFFTANPTGGSGSYTYSWSSTTGGSLTNTTSQTCTLTLSGDGSYDGLVTCQISDGVNPPIERSATVSVIIGVPP